MSQFYTPSGSLVTLAGKVTYTSTGQAIYAPASVPVIRVRAIVILGTTLQQVTDAMAGTNKRPLVLYQGRLQERVASEGTPVVLDQGQLRQILSGETLLI